jgi:4-hydroxy-2-oxoheptanedioate aldolase
VTSLREKWAAGEETLGLWLSLPSFVSAEIAARQPVDYVCVDTQHGVNDYLQSAAMIQAIELAGGNPIVRVPWNEPGVIGKSLDAGAHGVVVPMVNTREQAEAVVRSVRYAPVGARSWGPIMAAMRHADNRAWADEHIAVIPMIETGEAIANLDEILSVPGIDAIYVGPADLSLSLGSSPFYAEDDPVFTEALEKIVAACGRHGVVPGIHATGPLTQRRRDQGFRMITVTSDALAIRSGFSSELAAAKGGVASESGPKPTY